MNKIVAIILLVILALILILFIKAMVPALTGFLKNLPKGIFILLFLVIVGMMIYLIWYLANSKVYGGQQQNADLQEQEEQQEEEQLKGNDEIIQPDHCIVLRDDVILISDREADMDTVEKYIDWHVENNTEMVIVDDYSTAALHHRITKLCDEKGVNYRTENEEWIDTME
ncbi:MAG: hypothetical protein K6G60_01235 [Lachnospiraceae bacterium]|nr:hypothetical protein [Lachnospiraceae bacterium]